MYDEADLACIDKARLIELLEERLEESLRSVADAQQATQDGVTHEESRAENAKDTRSTEASYLARGLAHRVEELRQTAIRLDAQPLRAFGRDELAAPSALLALEDEKGKLSLILLIPAGGGETLEVDGMKVQLVTPGSPLGRALLGRGVDEDVEVELPGGVQSYRIVGIA